MTPRRPTARHIACIVFACLIAFCNVFSNEFHLDDNYRVEDNPGVQDFWPPWRHFTDPATSSWSPRLVQYRPLLPLSLSINYALVGDSLVGYHVGNLLLQIAAAIMVYFLVLELLARGGGFSPAPPAALFTALLFAVHPVSGYLVNYICSRDLLIMQVFLVASLWCYLRMRRLGPSLRRWIGSLVLLLLSLLAKQNAVVFPVLVGLFELLFTEGPRTRLWRVLPSSLLILGYLAWVRLGLGFSELGNVTSGSLFDLSYGGHQLQHHVFHYLRNLVWPFPLRVGAEDLVVGWQMAAGAGCLLGSWVVAWRCRRTMPWISYCILAYQALLALTSSVLPLFDEVVGYRPYAGSPFLFLAVSILLVRGRRGRWILVAAVVSFAAASLWINRTWRTDRSLWQHAVDYGGSARAYYNLAKALPDDDPDKRDRFERALELWPGYVTAHLGLGMFQIRSGEREAGVARIRAAVALDLDRAESRFWLAEALHAVGDSDGALAAAVAAQRLQPGLVAYRYAVGRMAFAARRPEVILAHLLALQSERPDHLDTVLMIAAAYHMQGRLAEAIPCYEHFLRQNPERLELHRNLAQCHRALGRDLEARRHEALIPKDPRR